MSTREELERELALLEQQDEELKRAQRHYDQERREKGFIKSKVYNGTKLAIVLIIVYLVIVGTFGSMHVGPFKEFSMDDFVKFLGSFSPIFITLTGSIGVGGIAKNVVKGMQQKKEQEVAASGEDFVKSGGV
jgi:hypothetical protein